MDFDGGEVDHLGRSQGNLIRTGPFPEGLEPEVLSIESPVLQSLSTASRRMSLFYEDY